jgi:RNA polymerase sigma factor (sigma-70 family)
MTQTATVDPLDHQGLVGRVARSFLGRGLDYDDLVQEGQFGLLRAAQSYDPDRGRFSTYATWWIVRYVRQAVRDQGNLIRVPAYLHPGSGSLRGSKYQADVFRAMRVSRLPADDVTDWREDDLAEADCARLASRRLSVAMARLPGRIRVVIALRYGLDGGGKRSLSEVGERLGVTKERARQLEQEGLGRLRESLAANKGG